MERKGGLKEKDHKDLDKFLGKVLDAYKVGEISTDSAVHGLAHVMAALDIGNTSEALAWFNQEGVEFFKEGDRWIGRNK